ncbi:hypothetical protein V6N11_001491 [Hibiscus sabdariffa]|uniref:Uncharacterized protein n=1 Tax=Hibiscus sabdariffa TaxID=183260 RepID=A0ABR2S0E3_9ROSI
MSSVSEVASSYADLILHDDGIPIILFEKCNIENLITNVGAGGSGGAPVVVAAPVVATDGGGVTALAIFEETKKEPKEESDDDMGFGLFDWEPRLVNGLVDIG